MSSVLVTGGFGYIGSVVVSALLHQGYAVTLLDNKITDRPEWQNAINSDILKIVTGDIRDEKCLMESLAGVEKVIHLAGISDGRAGRIDPEKTRAINTGAFTELVKLSTIQGIKRFLFASTFGVYGNDNTQILTEDLQVNPAEPYSQSKAECEDILQEQRSDSFLGISLRLAMVYGFSPTMRFDFIVNNLTWKALTTNSIQISGGEQKRPQIHIYDAADYFLRLLELPSQNIKSKLYNAGNENISLRALAELVSSTLKNKVEITYAPERQNENSFELDSGKIKKELDFSPNYSIKEAILEIENKFYDGHWKIPENV